MPSQSGNSPNGNAAWSDLSSQQIIQRAFQEATDTIRIDISSIDTGIIIPVTSGSFSVLGSYNIPYTSISHTTPFTITSGLSAPIKLIQIADTTGQTMKIAFASSFFYTNPGCEHEVPILVPLSTALTIQSQETSDPVAGNFIITLLG